MLSIELDREGETEGNGRPWKDATTVAAEVAEALPGVRTGLDDPLLGLLGGMAGQDLQPHQEAIVRQAAGLVEGLQAP